MREIKFRGYNKEIGKWFYGNLFLTSDKRYFIRMCPVINSDGDYIDMIVEPESVGQFTGLKDKNGKEIYKGDIVIKQTKNDGGGKPIENGRVLGTFVVRWSNNNCGFDINNTGGHGYEVIGNIYENPELLEEQNGKS